MASAKKTLIELAQDFDVHPNQIKQWRDRLLEGATGVFGDGLKSEPEPVIDVKTLHAKNGELTLENDASQGLGARSLLRYPARSGRGGSVAERRKMIDPTAKLSVSRQAIVLGISRGSVHDQPRPVPSGDLTPMRSRTNGGQ